LGFAATVKAELNDNIVSPNTVNAGIAKTLEQQVVAGCGDINTPESSIYY